MILSHIIDMGYTQIDIDSLYNYMKNNPSSSLEQWYEFRSKNITNLELELYKNIKYSIVKFKDKDLFIFNKGYNSNFFNFIEKFTANKSYFILGEYDSEELIVLGFDEMQFEDCDKNNEYEDIFTLETEDYIFDCSLDSSEEQHYSYMGRFDFLSKKYLCAQDGYYWFFYLKNKEILMNDIKDLFVYEA